MTTFESGFLMPLSTIITTQPQDKKNSPAIRATAFDRLDELLPFYHLPKDGVLAIEVRRWDSSDEELGAIGVGAGICHAGHGNQ